jgi:uncharacterized protein (DUF1786 family)
MSNWIHSICSDCWDAMNPNRLAVRISEGTKDICCYCGREHTSHIFVRDNPFSLSCLGKRGHHVTKGGNDDSYR